MLPATAEVLNRKQDISEAAVTNLKTAYVYTGKAIKPRFEVMSDFTETIDKGDGTISATTYFIFLEEGKDYSVTYKNNTKIGTATVVINGIGDYEGTILEKYKILPKSTKIKKLSSGKKQMTISAYKADGGCSYQFAYKKADSKKWIYTSSKNQTKKIKRLESGKTYFAKVRAFKTVKGKMYNGKWSPLRKKTVK